MATASNVAFLKASADHQAARAETVEELAHVREFHVFLPPLLPCPTDGCFSAFPRDAAIKEAQKLVGASCALRKGISDARRRDQNHPHGRARGAAATMEALVDLVAQFEGGTRRHDCRSRSR